MKRAASVLLLLFCAVLLTSCMSPDDHDFFVKGWVNPRALDTAPPGSTPVRPLASDTRPGGVVPSSAPVAPSSGLTNSQAVQDGWVPATPQ